MHPTLRTGERHVLLSFFRDSHEIFGSEDYLKVFSKTQGKYAQNRLDTKKFLHLWVSHRMLIAKGGVYDARQSGTRSAGAPGPLAGQIGATSRDRTQYVVV